MLALTVLSVSALPAAAHAGYHKAGDTTAVHHCRR
jgi:hypothetical protein